MLPSWGTTWYQKSDSVNRCIFTWIMILSDFVLILFEMMDSWYMISDISSWSKVSVYLKSHVFLWEGNKTGFESFRSLFSAAKKWSEKSVFCNIQQSSSVHLTWQPLFNAWTSRQICRNVHSISKIYCSVNWQMIAQEIQPYTLSFSSSRRLLDISVKRITC